MQIPNAITDPALATYLSGVSADDLAFTIGFSDKVGRVFHPGDPITAGRVFLAYAAAESQPVPGGES